MTEKIIGVFDTEQEATRAIESLQSQGFTNDEISVITKDRDDLKHISEDTGTMAPEGVATGAATGGVVGGITGLLAGIGALAIPGIGPTCRRPNRSYVNRGCHRSRSGRSGGRINRTRHSRG